MDADEHQPARARVRQHLIEPLERDGLVRHRRTTATDHAEFLLKVQDRLGYMTDANLQRMRHTLLPLAGGSARNIWPSWATIWNFATGYQTPPDPNNPIMQTWLHSRRGPALRDAGELVETYEFLRRANRPPTDYDLRQISEASRDNAIRRQLIKERIARGADVGEDRAWLAWYDRTEEICSDIVDAGMVHRRSRGVAS